MKASASGKNVPDRRRRVGIRGGGIVAPERVGLCPDDGLRLGDIIRRARRHGAEQHCQQQQQRAHGQTFAGRDRPRYELRAGADPVSPVGDLQIECRTGVRASPPVSKASSMSALMALCSALESVAAQAGVRQAGIGTGQGDVRKPSPPGPVREVAILVPD
jgi:hypothetical protein